MIPFEYHAPHNLQDALALLSDNGRPLAGGTDLFLRMERRQIEPSVLVDLKQIPGLGGLALAKNEVRIGARAVMQDIASAPLITERCSALAAAARVVGSSQTRNRATLGGNVANASPAADTIPPLIALGARAHALSRMGERVLSVNELFVGPGQTVLGHGEILTQFSIPAPPPHSASSFERCTRTAMDIALANCAVFLSLDEAGSNRVASARIALGAVGPTVICTRAAATLLVGQPYSDKLSNEVAECAMESASPIDDVRASAGYRRDMVRVLTRRAIKGALRAAGGRV